MKKFEQVYLGNDLIGEVYQNQKYIIFYGSKKGTFENIKTSFPDLSFNQLEQIHSNYVVKSEENKNFKADGFWTKQKEQALCIKTADCLPVFIIENDLAIAVHAGWRGIESEIIIEALLEVEVNSTLEAFIGPHIQLKSFEIGLDVNELLTTGYEKLGKFDYTKTQLNGKHIVDDKTFINLSKIARTQLLSCGIKATNIYASATDTYSDHIFNSFRRDSEDAGRNISFCCLI